MIKSNIVGTTMEWEDINGIIDDLKDVMNGIDDGSLVDRCQLAASLATIARPFLGA